MIFLLAIAQKQTTREFIARSADLRPLRRNKMCVRVPSGAKPPGPRCRMAPKRAVALRAVINASPAGSDCDHTNATEEPPTTGEMVSLRAFVEKSREAIFCAR
jgi:hypothetical protein